jgi:hypothetical protein
MRAYARVLFSDQRGKEKISLEMCCAYRVRWIAVSGYFHVGTFPSFFLLLLDGGKWESRKNKQNNEEEVCCY